METDDLDQASLDGPRILSRMERMLPLYYATINQHILLHLPDRIRLYGPLHCSHMYVSTCLLTLSLVWVEIIVC